MQKIVITIKEGRLTGVYTDGEPIIVDLLDYDDLFWETDDEANTEATAIENDIASGKLKACW